MTSTFGVMRALIRRVLGVAQSASLEVPVNTLICVSLLTLWPLAAFAQTAEITGLVTDPSGGVVPDAPVAVTNVDTGIRRIAESNAQGYYTVTLLQPGNYEVSVKREGFVAVTRSGIHLIVDQKARLDFALKIGQVSETVSVTAAAPVVDSESAAVGQVIDNKRVVELPLNGRNFLQLAALSPGVRVAGKNQFTGEPSVNVSGNRAGSTGFQIDGAENYEQNAQTAQISPSIETVQEFKVQSTSFSADSGRQAAIVSVVTKSGTNSFHGDLFEFLRNKAVDSRNFFSLSPNPEDLKRNQFGGTAGGALIKNKLFFFGGFEATRQRRAGISNRLVPDDAQRAGDMQGLNRIFDPATTDRASRSRQPFPGNIIPASRLDPIATGLLKYIPGPNAPEDRYIASNVGRLFDDQYNIRIDHRLTDKDSYFFRYTQDHRNEVLPGAFPIPGGDQQEVFSINGILSYTHSFSPTQLNEFHFTGTRFDLDFDTLSKGLDVIDPLGIQGLEGRKLEHIEGFPILNVTGYGNFGDIGIRPLKQKFNTFNWYDEYTWIKGKHTLKFGADVRRYQRAAFNGINARGNFTYSGQLTQNPLAPGGTGNGLADFMLGLPTNSTKNYPRLRQLVFWTNIGSFVQDDWKVTRRLTLNLGLRHDFQGQPLEKYNRIGSFDYATGQPIAASGSDGKINSDAYIFFTQEQLDYLGVAAGANLGFPARTLRDNHYHGFAPRLGFAYNVFGNDKTVIRGGYGIFYTLVGGNLSTEVIGSVPFFLGQTAVTNSLVPTLTTRNAFPSSSAQITPDIFSYQKDFNDSYIQSWSFNVQQQLDPNTMIEVGYVGSKGTHLDMTYPSNQPLLPGPGAIQPRRPYPKFASISLHTTIGYSDYNALELRAERHFSKGLTYMASYTWSKGLGMTGGDQNPWNLNDGKSLNDFDIPQRLVLSTVWDLPVGKGRHFLNRGGLWNWVLGGWQLGNIFTAQSGLPFSPTTGRDIANIGTSTRPNRLGQGTVTNPTINHWFDASAFANPAPYTFGNSGINFLRGPRSTNLDTVLNKRFEIHEARYVEFRAEFFNILNHPNFGTPSANINQPNTVGQIFGASDPRIIQFGLKLYW